MTRAASDRLVIPVGALEQGRTPLVLSADPGTLDLGEWIRPLSRLEIEGSIDRFGETITVRGHVRARVTESCDRCTREFETALDAEFLVFSDRIGSDEESMARALAEEGEVVYHDGISLDVTRPVREAIILSRPMNTLCREDCRGLCAGCGADLNTESCRCQERPPDPRWEALNRLKESS